MPCNCLCHNANRGNQRCCAHKGKLFEAFFWAQEAMETDTVVNDADILEAAVACEKCRVVHCPALMSRVRWTPPEPKEKASIDGFSLENGEGAE